MESPQSHKKFSFLEDHWVFQDQFPFCTGKEIKFLRS